MTNTATLLRGTSAFTASSKFGSAALAGGVYEAPTTADSFLSTTGLPGGTLIGGTVEGWIKTTASSTRVAIGHDTWYWIGITAAGLPTLHYGGSGEIALNGSAPINDGDWHHVAAVFGSANRRLYVDGVQVASSTTGKTVGTSFENLCVGGFNSVAGAPTDWAGSGGGLVDEVRISNTERYSTTPFAPPVAAFTPDANTVALYRLDGDAKDAASPSVGTISVATASGNDTITYPAPTAGGNAVAGVRLYKGAFSGGQSATAVADNAGTSGGTFVIATPASGEAFYFVRAYDTAGTPNLSDPSNEVSTGTPVPPTVPANDSDIAYSPFNWQVDGVGARTINSGAYFSALIENATAISMRFNVGGVSTPLPKIAYRIDGGPWTVAEVSGSITIPIPADNTWPKHLVEVMVVATTEGVNRWNSPFNTQVRFLGFECAGTSVATSAIGTAERRVLVFGDSITEGVRTLRATATSGKDTDRNSALVGWAYALRELLGAEVGIVGFGRQGVTIAGNGNVPALSTAYASLWSGQARSLSSPPDVIVINMGTNDLGQGASVATFRTAYTALLNALLAATPKTTKIAVVVPFNLAYGVAAYDILVAACNAPNRVKVIDTTGWYDSADSSDTTHPYGYTNVGDLAPLLAGEIRALLGRGVIYTSIGGEVVQLSNVSI